MEQIFILYVLEAFPTSQQLDFSYIFSLPHSRYLLQPPVDLVGAVDHDDGRGHDHDGRVDGERVPPDVVLAQAQVGGLCVRRVRDWQLRQKLQCVFPSGT